MNMARKKEQKLKFPHPIDLRYRCVRSFWGKKKIVATSLSEQKRYKKNLLKFFPDTMFYDDLNEENSIDPTGRSFTWNVWDKPIDIRYRCKKTIFGKRKVVTATIIEQEKVKKILLKFNPDGLFYDDLGQANSVRSNRISYNANDGMDGYVVFRSSSSAFKDDACDYDDDNCDCDCDCDCDD